MRHRDHHVAGGRSDRRHVRCLDPEVQLLPQRQREAVGQLAHAHRPRPGRGRDQRAGEPVDDVEVALDHRTDAGPLHLQHHLLAGGERRCVHLGHAGRRQRLRRDGREHLLDRPAELGHQGRLDLGPGRRRRPVLQPAQLGDELGRQQVAPGGQQLAELDEGDPALVERGGERAGQLLPPGRIGTGPPPPAQRPAEAVPHRDPDDLAVPPGAGRARFDQRPPLVRRRHRAGRDQHLGQHQEDHRGQQGDRDRQHEQAELAGRAGVRVARAVHRREQRAGQDERDDAGQQRADDPEPQPEQPPGDPGQRQHGQRRDDGDQGVGEQIHWWATLTAPPAPRAGPVGPLLAGFPQSASRGWPSTIPPSPCSTSSSSDSELDRFTAPTGEVSRGRATSRPGSPDPRRPRPR